MNMTKALIAGAAGFALAACGADAPDPSGDIQIIGDQSEFAVGDVINLEWSSQDTDRVYITVSTDDTEDMMLSESGFGAAGTREFQVDPTAFAFDDDQDVTIEFKLKAPDPDGEMETLDSETVEIEAAQT